jgi:GNAT superfamily N-acetyltransferase
MNTIKLLGWRSMRRSLVSFFKCPGCLALSHGMGGEPDGLCLCFRCEERFPRESWRQVQAKRNVATCSACEADVEMTAQGRCGLFYCCECGNIVAVPYRNQKLQPQEVMNLARHPGLKKRATEIAPYIFATPRLGFPEHLAVGIMFKLAQQEDHSFKWGSERYHRDLLCFDAERFLGYLRWSHQRRKKEIILHQIFVMTDLQRRGIGTTLLRHWAEKYAFPFVERFGAEQANEKSMGILQKLGYIRGTSNNTDWIRCYELSGI